MPLYNNNNNNIIPCICNISYFMVVAATVAYFRCVAVPSASNNARKQRCGQQRRQRNSNRSKSDRHQSNKYATNCTCSKYLVITLKITKPAMGNMRSQRHCRCGKECAALAAVASGADRFAHLGDRP